MARRQMDPRWSLDGCRQRWAALQPRTIFSKAVSPQAWLATSDDELARSTGGYFYHQRSRAPNRIADDVGIQEELLAECSRISGIPLTLISTLRLGERRPARLRTRQNIPRRSRRGSV